VTEVDPELLLDVRRVRREFLRTVEPLRPRLFGYCRRLTANVWDAEDLVQETLAKAFARAAQAHGGIDNVEAWLIRVATNTYIDTIRRSAPLLVEDLDGPAPTAVDPAEVGDALEELMTVLPAQERAAIVLKDVFELSLSEIASLTGSSVGGVKAALHRGRAALGSDAERARRASRPSPDPVVLREVAAAFSAYDIDALAALLREDSVMNLVGMVYETGPDEMRNGSFHHTFELEDDVRYTAEVREFEGEPVIAVWSRPVTHQGDAGISEVWRCATEDGKLTVLTNYFFAPEVVTEVAASWDAPTVLHGYRYA
jgi:RNA polymerase sigma-70 factor (ECF subfamily)